MRKITYGVGTLLVVGFAFFGGMFFAQERSEAVESGESYINYVDYGYEREQSSLAEKLEAYYSTTNTQKGYRTELMEITAYCGCEKCCGEWANGKTSTNKDLTERRTIAVDPDIIPYGSKVEIGGVTYVAEDCGGAIKGSHINIYMSDHQDALDWGVKYLEVKIYE